MSCAQWEERLALLAGGEARDPEAERHAAECAGCAALIEELRADRSALALTQLPWGATDAVHARVMEKAGRRRMAWWWTPAPVAAALALVWMMWPPPAEVEPPVVTVWRAPAPEVRAAPVRTVSRPVVQAVERTEEFVKLLTDDEDVVILWALDAKGDTQ